MKNIYKIYVLEFNNEIIYVGQTTQELYNRKKINGYSLIDREIVKQSKIKLIEETTDISHERFWINYFTEQGYNLYNKQKGNGYIRKDYMKEYRLENKEHIKECNKEYNKTEKEKDRKKEWFKKNPDYMKEYRKKQKQII